MRTQLDHQGYTQPYGTEDHTIAHALGIAGKHADIVAYHPETGRWLVAESKGGDVDTAYEQLANTAGGLLQQGIDVSTVDVTVYTSPQQYAKLAGPDGLGGWQVRDNYLGWIDEFGQWHAAEVVNVQIGVQQVSLE